jgi:hypothetical protein
MVLVNCREYLFCFINDIQFFALDTMDHDILKNMQYIIDI